MFFCEFLVTKMKFYRFWRSLEFFGNSWKNTIAPLEKILPTPMVEMLHVTRQHVFYIYFFNPRIWFHCFSP